MMRARKSVLFGNIALAAAYIIGGKFGLALASVNASASAVWPPTGVALAALLLWGYRLWPGVFVGAFVVNITTQGSLASNLGIATGNTLEALTGAWLVCHFAAGPKAFERASTFFRFVVLAALVSTSLSASIGVTSLGMGGFAPREQYRAIWQTWWLGDTVSDVIIAPLLIIWFHRGFQLFKPSQALEAAGLLLAVLLVGWVLFPASQATGAQSYPLTYLAIPPLLWAAFRFDERGAATTVFIMAALALWGTLRGLGPFARPDSNESLLLLQAFLGTIALTTLALAISVSERKRALNALQESEATFRAFFDTAIVGTAQTDEAGRLVEVNEAYCRITGYDRQELRGMDPVDFVPPQEREADRERLRWFYQRQAPTYNAEKRYVRKDGKVIWVHVAAGAVCNAAGQLVRTAAIVEDITARKAAEQQLKLQAVALESAANAILITNRQGLIKWVNQAFTELTGYSATEALEQTPRLLKSGQHQRTFFKAMWDTVLAGNVWHGEVVNKRKDGSCYTEEMTITPVRNGEGGASHFIAIKQDVTQRREAERALQEAKEELARSNARLEELVAERTARLREIIADLEHFSYSIVHDLRAPLRAIQSFAGLIKEDSGQRLTPEAREYLARMSRAASRMDRLITDSLSYSKAVRGELPRSPVELGPLLRGMLESYPELAAHRADVALEGDFPRVLGNEPGLIQCFSNLLHNALKFAKPSQTARVRIRAEPRDPFVRVWVEDNGIGIPEHGREKIFGMFQRLHGAEYEGTGIGLALVRKVMERMGGRVGVESAAGDGSRFWVELRSAD